MRFIKISTLLKKVVVFQLFIFLIGIHQINGQNTELILKKVNSNKQSILRQYKKVTVYKSEDSVTAYFDKFTENCIYIRRYDRDSNAIEDSYATRGRELDEMIKQNWRVHDDSKVHYPTDPYNQNVSPRAHIYRSTDIDSIPFSEIDVIQFRKVEKDRGGPIGFFIVPLLALTSPLWARDDNGEYDWGAGVALLGLTTYLTLTMTINMKRSENRKYIMDDWDIEK